MTAAATDAIAILRIEIEDIEPLIWRRVAVRTSLNLKALHKVVQASMGWLDYHLWEFTADGRKYGILIPDDPHWNRRINNAASTKLSALLTTGVTGLGYVYDFGDDWKHRIIVEETSSPLRPVHPIPGSWAVSADARPRTAAARRVILSSLKTSPASGARKPKTPSNGTAALTTRTTSMSSKLKLPWAGSPTPTGQDDQKPSRHNVRVGRLTLTGKWLPPHRELLEMARSLDDRKRALFVD
jgi:hypothetical protein